MHIRSLWLLLQLRMAHAVQCTHQEYAVCIWAVQSVCKVIQCSANMHSCTGIYIIFILLCTYVCTYVSVTFMHHEPRGAERQSICFAVLPCVQMCGCLR